MLFTKNTLSLVVKVGVVDHCGTGDDGVSRNSELLAFSIFAKNALVSVSLNLGQGEDLYAFLLKLTQLWVLVDNADFSTSLLSRLDNRTSRPSFMEEATSIPAKPPPITAMRFLTNR